MGYNVGSSMHSSLIDGSSFLFSEIKEKPFVVNLFLKVFPFGNTIVLA